MLTVRTRLLAAVTFAFALPSAVCAEPVVDPAHTSATFNVRHLTLTTVTGKIGITSASIGVGPDHVLTRADATFDLKSIDTRESDRDDDLRSDHWFDVAKYPVMTFKSSKITGDKNAMQVDGDLTFHGITKPVTLTAKFEGSIVDGKGRTHVGYSATGTLDRTQWDLGTGFPPAVVGNEITIGVELEAIGS